MKSICISRLFFLISMAMIPLAAHGQTAKHRTPKSHHHASARDPYDINMISPKMQYKLWMIIDAADDRAFKLAGGDPTTGTSSDATDFEAYSKLNEKFQDQIERRYHITDEQLAAIKAKADDKHWPGSMPKQ